MQKRVMEISCYVAGAGAFGVFLRWLQDQLAFNDAGLPDPSAFHVLLPLYILVCAVVFYRFVKRYAKAGLALPEDFQGAFRNEGRLYTLLRWAIGGLMFVGGVLLLMTTELDKYAGMLRALSFAAMLAGLSFPVLMTLANREDAKPNLLCLLAFLPIFLYAVWLVYCYRANSINSVIWSYVVEVGTVIMAMVAFFRIAGFPFNAAKIERCFFDIMFAAMLCLLSLADERYMGMHIILFSSALMFLFCNWVMICNLKPVEKQEPVRTETVDDNGFEHL